eukprot:6442840-Pyramimonas_sp.AAC.1
MTLSWKSRHASWAMPSPEGAIIASNASWKASVAKSTILRHALKEMPSRPGAEFPDLRIACRNARRGAARWSRWSM